MNPFQALPKNCEKRLLTLSCSSVRPSAWNNSAPTGQIFMKFDFFRKSVKKIQDSLNSDKNNVYFTQGCMYTNDSISLNYSWNEKCYRKICRENQNIHFMFIFFRKQTPCEIMWKNVVEPDKPQLTIQHGTCTSRAR